MKPKKVALTGGIATGKSTVAKMFAGLGALILDADQVAREVVQPGSPCWRELRGLLGPEFFDPDGQIRRRKLRDCIIRDDLCRSKVNSILHPSILSAMQEEWEKLRRTNPDRPVIFDVPLLYEANLALRFDTVILAYAPPQVQVQRLMARDGLTQQEAEKTLTMQLPIESKKNKAHIIIDNSLDLAHTFRQVEQVWEMLWPQGGLRGE